METTSGFKPRWLRLTALICVAALVPGDIPLLAQQPAAAPDDAPKLKTGDQLDSLVAPIALYPDPLLAQVLAATTYPLEVVECARWLKQNSTLKGEDLTKAAAKQSWDPSVQALVAFPTALKLLDENIGWTTDMGNAFLDQQTDVMASIQRQRKKAKDSGKLESSKEQKVEVKTVEQKTIVEIQPADPQVIYVPSYNPVVVYGAPPVYAYPPIVYPPPPSYGAVAATAAISFGVGVAMGAMWGGCCGGGGYGWGCGWSNNNITINNNFQTRYNYNNIQGGNRTNINGGNRTNVGNGNSSWQHNASHRRSVPYGSTRTAQQFGGSARNSRGQTQRVDNAGRNSGVGQNRGGVGDRNSGVGDRNSGVGQNRGGVGDRNSGVGQSGGRNSGAGGGQDRVGNHSFDSGSGKQSALGGSGSADRSRAASDRGFASSRSSGGGGGGGAAKSSGGARSGGGGGGGRGGGGGGRRR